MAYLALRYLQHPSHLPAKIAMFVGLISLSNIPLTVETGDVLLHHNEVRDYIDDLAGQVASSHQGTDCEQSYCRVM